MSDWLQTLIGLVIVGMVLFAIWQNGRRNPESTGRLSRRMAALESKVGNTATKAELGLLAGEVRELEAKAATSSEVVAVQLGLASLRGDVDVVRERVDGIGHSTERTESAVRRIEGYFIEQGVKGGNRK